MYDEIGERGHVYGHTEKKIIVNSFFNFCLTARKKQTNILAGNLVEKLL